MMPNSIIRRQRIHNHSCKSNFVSCIVPPGFPLASIVTFFMSIITEVESEALLNEPGERVAVSELSFCVLPLGNAMVTVTPSREVPSRLVTCTT